MTGSEDYVSSSLLPWIDIKAKNFKNFMNLGVKKIYKKNSAIVEQGEKTDSIFYLSKGKVKVLLLTTQGEEKLFWYASEGNIIGDVPFFHFYPSNASIIAEEDCEVYIYDRNTFLNILHTNPEFADYMLNIMARKIRVLVNQVQDISFNNPTKRISKLLYLLTEQFGRKSEKGTELKLDITHKEIASITCVHRVTVTNVLSNLKNEGVIKKSKLGTIIIIDKNKLHKYAFD
ncbi:MAG: family transcriptional regulator, reductive dehalogenation system regulator [Clostridia bacterium]|jgi:CRP/FNR family transcriptional regulator|nr:family transcriptional regulator, reductive dehalogenation system regulator [Clostridia bacterium]MDN5322018.1 family transcriptional regulator, reductive dehalogenation system regulator [Clostridia bacterium]